MTSCTCMHPMQKGMILVRGDVVIIDLGPTPFPHTGPPCCAPSRQLIRRLLYHQRLSLAATCYPASSVHVASPSGSFFPRDSLTRVSSFESGGHPTTGVTS